MNEYVVIDRTTSVHKAIKINDNQLYYETTVNAASSEPIIQDNINAGTYWKLFIDDDQLGWEQVVTVRDDHIDLDDEAFQATYRLFISDGQLNWYEIPYTPFGEPRLIAVRKLVDSHIIAIANGNRSKVYYSPSVIVMSSIEGRLISKVQSRNVSLINRIFGVVRGKDQSIQIQSSATNNIVSNNNINKVTSIRLTNNVIQRVGITKQTKSRILS